MPHTQSPIPEPKYREFCWNCRRPAWLCLCPTADPMPTKTRIVLLMHPMEWKRERCATGRLTCLNLKNSEIIPGIKFCDNPRYRALVEDPHNYPMLLYPGKEAYDLSTGDFPSAQLGSKRLVIFLIDATWSCARVMLRESPCLRTLPCVKFTPSAPSQYIIKRQPAPNCLSTIEATHELLLALEQSGLDTYPDKKRLLSTFLAMRDYQLHKIKTDSTPRTRYTKAQHGNDS